MPIPQLPGGGLSSLDDVINYVIRLERELRFLMEGGLDSTNMFEVGGWRINPTQFASKNGNVGMSPDGTSPSSVRFWAGSSTSSSAPFRVTDDGSLYSTKGFIGGWTIGANSLVSSLSGNRIELTPGSLDIYDSNNKKRLSILETYSTNLPAFVLYDPNGVEAGRFVSNYAGRSDVVGTGNSSLTLNDNTVLNGTNITLQTWGGGTASVNSSQIRVAGNATSTVGTHNHGIPDGTVLMVNGGGTVTFSSSGSHSHTL